MHTKAEFTKKTNKDTLSRIWLAIMKMDVSELHLLLEDHTDYEDIGKVNFIKKLELNFNKHKRLGDNEFYIDLDVCKGCNCNSSICKFIGNKSKLSFGLYFEIKQGVITDIYHCNLYGKFDF